MDDDLAASARTPWQASSIASDMGFLLARSHARSLDAGNAALREFGLKMRSYPILALVCDDVRPTQRELAEVLRLDPSQIVALVDELEQRGLLERQVDARDRRAKVLVPTVAGHALCATARKAVRVAEDTACSSLTVEERLQLAALLQRIAGISPHDLSCASNQLP